MDKPFCPQCEREFDAGLKFCPEDGSELIIRSEDTITGQVFDGRYTIQFKLGEGGMGAVYKATQISTGKPVAIKVVSKKLAKNPATVSRFQREVKLQSKLEHPNIVTVVDFAKTPDGQYFFVMPFVEGKSLRQLILDEGKFSIKDFMELAGQILDGLEFAHAKGIIHRDLKGDNISIAFLGHHRVAKILDFGLAKAIQQESEATMSGAGTQEGRVLGTPAYMSPEQALGEISKIDQRSDIYSIGVVFYQMLTGKLPFTSNTPWGVMHKHIEETPSPLREVAPEISEKIEAVILRCLEKDRDKRYQTALDVKKNLEIAATGGDPDVTTEFFSKQEDKTVDAPPPSSGKSRGGAKTALTTLLVLAVVGAAGYFGYAEYEKGQEKTRQAELTLAQMQADNLKKESEEKTRLAEEERQRQAELENKRQAEKAAQKAEADRKANIAKLLATAETDFKANRLTSPKGKNALERYRAILDIDPENETAKSGIENIAARYVELAEGSIKKKEFDKAEKYLAKAVTVQPSRENIGEIKAGLTTAREKEHKRKAELAKEYMTLTKKYLGERNLKKAEEFIVKAEELAPGSREVNKLRADLEEKKRIPKNMVVVKGGCFDMGDTFGDGEKDEKPVHRVCLDDFLMDKYEVTQSNFQRVIGSNPSYFSGCSLCPVEQVTWYEAKNYCEQVGKRLPTEAEWEYAARSGGKREKYAGVYNLSSVAWYIGNSGDMTHPVGQKQANGFGLYDMSGNAWEWVADWFGQDYYGKSLARNPKGASSGEYRVLRGGSYKRNPGRIRAADRDYDLLDYRASENGFRCAR